MRSSRTRAVLGSILSVGLIALAACPSPETGSGNSDAATTDSVTQRERYEAVGESNLPGSQGVRGALDASDDIRAREARRDSLLRDF